MKKLLLFVGTIGLLASVHAQQSIQDSVSMDPGYANDVYYILSTGEKQAQPIDNWQIGFSTSVYSAAVFSNAKDVVVKEWPNGDVTQFESAIDTTGFLQWSENYNDSADWEIGSFNQNSSGFSYGWGSYNDATHEIVGDKVYLVKVGSDLYKVYIVKKAMGEFTVKYGLYTADASGISTLVFNCSDYASKQFIFFDLTTGQLVDREKEGWDMWFTKYHDLYSNGTIQTVTGILTSPSWEVTAVEVGAGNQETATDYSGATWSTVKDIIGDSYKSLSYVTFQWSVSDSIVYYLRNANGDIWKWYATDFGGSSTGTTKFVKQQLETAGIATEDQQFFDIYPNPVQESLTFVFDSKSTSATVQVKNQMGQTVMAKQFSTPTGIYKQELNLSGLTNGLYFIEIIQDNQAITKKIIKR